MRWLALLLVLAAGAARGQSAPSALGSQIDAVANAYHDEDADKAAHVKKAEAQADEETDMAVETDHVQLEEQQLHLREEQIAADRENDIIDHGLRQEDAGTNVLNATAGAIARTGKVIGVGKMRRRSRRHRSSDAQEDDSF
jgi:hypothetical protein